MKTQGKTITLFLMDGDATGRIKTKLSNSTVLVYRIPRGALDSCDDMSVLDQSGVYLLFGVDGNTGKEAVYIGQAGIRKNGKGVLYRLKEHRRDAQKDFWTEALVITTSDDSWGPTEISWLENQFTNLAISAKRYVVKNNNEPSLGHVTEEKESELSEFTEKALIVVGVLGHQGFNPLLPKPSYPEIGNANQSLEFFLSSRNGVSARGRLTHEGFVLCAGSVLRKELLKSASDSTRHLREQHRGDVDDQNRTTKDLLFTSPSGASSFVLGGSSNGRRDWKTKEGKVLAEVENNEIL